MNICKAPYPFRKVLKALRVNLRKVNLLLDANYNIEYMEKRTFKKKTKLIQINTNDKDEIWKQLILNRCILRKGFNAFTIDIM